LENNSDLFKFRYVIVPLQPLFNNTGLWYGDCRVYGMLPACNIVHATLQAYSVHGTVQNGMHV